MKKQYLILSFLFISISAISQISHGGIPLSFTKASYGFIQQQVSTVTMPGVDEEKLRAEDMVNDLLKDVPWRFGQNIPVNLNPTNYGTWDYLPDGSKLWRLRIFSPGALTINLIFNKYVLPAGATVFIYNEAHTHVLGSFTKANNQKDKVFATTLVNGDAVTVEYFEPAHPEFSGELNITNVTHGYRGAADFAEKSFGGSGSCNVNVACPQSSGWESQIRSACMLVSGGSGFCSGALINNTNNDGTPYVLTANHCYSAPSSWVFWFNWQSATCTNPTTSPSYQSISGAVLCARNATSDFCLVQMNSAPPANYNVYYSGWNRTVDDTLTGTVFGIHHPSGDIKKISWSALGVSTTTYLGTTGPGDGSHWRITNWSDGTTTEGGSSGSPLFDPNHRIIGQLHGGYASCTSLTSDYYGKLGVSWTGGGTISNMLQPWLDPHSTNPMALDGYDPNTPASPLDGSMINILTPVNAYCGPQLITPTVIIQNKGSQNLISALVGYDIDGNNGVSIQWTGNLAYNETDTVYFPPIMTVPGTMTLNAGISMPNGGIDTINTNDVYSRIFSVGNLYPPQATGNQACFSGSLDLTATGNGEIHWFDQPASGNDLYTGNVFTTPQLSATTTYYAEDHIISPSQYVGPVDNTTGGGTTANLSYEIFDCYTPVTLISVSVNATTAGDRLIQLKNSAGTVLQSVTVTIPAGVSRIPLNFNIPAGVNLQLTGPANSGLYRLNTGVVYPYTIPGLLSITSSSASSNPQNYFYFFFDWEVKEPDCISGRTPVDAVIVPMPVADFTYAQNQNDILFTNTSTAADSWTWDFGDGSGSFLENPIHTYTIEGTFDVSLTAINSCGQQSVNVQVPVYTGIQILPTENALSIYPNPARDYLVINHLTINNGYRISVIDNTGKEILLYNKLQAEKESFLISLSCLPSGTYTLQICSKLEIQRFKIIKLK